MIQNPQNTNGESPSTGNFQIDPIGLLRRKFGTICFFVLLCTALATLFFFKAPKTYESAAKFFIDDHRAPTMSTDGEPVNEANVLQFIEMLDSHAVLSKAIENTEIDNMASLKDADGLDEILFTVRENLKVATADNKAASDVIKIRYQCGIEEDCQILLTNIMESFKSFIESTNRGAGGEMRETIGNLSEQQLLREKEVEARIAVLSKKHNVYTIDQKVYNRYEGTIASLQTELDELASQRLNYETLLRKLNDSSATGQNEDEMLLEILQGMGDAPIGDDTATQQSYLELKVREQELMGDFGDDHPELRNIRSQLLVVEKLQKEHLLSAIRTDSSIQSSGGFQATVRNHVHNKIELAESHESQLVKAIADAKSKSLEVSIDCDELAKLFRERQQLEDSRYNIEQRIGDLEATSEFDFRSVTELDPPSTAEQVHPDLLICIASGLMLGFMLGTMFSILKELAEKTFRSSDEVSRQLGVPVVAQIGVFNSRIPRDSNYKKVNSDVISLHRPQSISAESYKALRTSVFFNAQDSDTKVIQITSPSPGDGKSTVSSNLAVVMAQSGRKVLLIDCDFRKPSQHARFGLKNKIGMTSVITGEATIDEAIQDIGLPNLHLISSGPQYANPAELLTTERFPSLLDSLRREYDFIILDTPPVLPVTDPVIISGYADVIYIPMRIRNGVQVNAQRAIEALNTVGANVKGIVVNGLRKKDAGYNYGSYGGYGYGTYGQKPYGNYGNYKAAPTPSVKGPNFSISDSETVGSRKHEIPSKEFN